MKLSQSKVDPKKVEQGAWVGEKYGMPIPDMADLCLQVRGVGNRDFRAMTQRLIDAVPRKQRVGGRLSPSEQDRITAICLRETCLLGWENVDGDGVIGEDGKPVQFDKKVADKLLNEPAYRRFYEAVLWAATIVGEDIETAVEDTAGN